MKRTIVLLALCSAACTSPRQLLLVSTPGWSSVDGTMQRYERSRMNGWKEAGAPIPVVVGRNGMAAEKREGDGRSPSGTFELGPAFGFDATAANVKLPYIQLQATTECVDDVRSAHYNEVVNRSGGGPAAWKSSEKMREVDQYRRGAVVRYNMPPRPGAGSCIFLHIWSGAGQGTAGCTAMSAASLDEVLHWLAPGSHPRLLQVPASELPRVRSQWHLP